jgi:hypothetical protein
MREAEEMLEGQSQHSSLALNSGRTSISLQRRLRRRRSMEYGTYQSE